MPIKRSFIAAVALAVASLGLAVLPASALPPDCEPGDPSCDVPWRDFADRTLTVSTTHGTVSSSTGGISCGTTCVGNVQVEIWCDSLGCEPWPAATQFALTASGGPTGHEPRWALSGAALGSCGASSSTCTVSLGDAETGEAAGAVAVSWVDPIAPTVTFSPPAKVGPTGYTVTAAAVDNSGTVVAYRWVVDNVLQASTVGTLSLSALPHGAHTVAVQARDAAGNFSSLVARTVTVDKQAGLTLVAPSPLTNASSAPVTFTADADVVSTTCALNATGPVPCTSGWSGVVPTSPDGSYSYHVLATDDVGNQVTRTATFVLDRTAPSVLLVKGPAEGETVAGDSATFAFSHLDAHRGTDVCRLDGGPWFDCPADSDVVLAALTNGPHTFTVQAVDQAGNQSTVTRSFGVALPTAPAPVTEPTPAPAPAPVTVSSPFRPGVSAEWVVEQERTTYTKIIARTVPSRATVKLTCLGGSCPWKARTIRHSGGKVSVLATIGKVRVRKGADLTLKIVRPDGARKLVTWTARAGMKPRVTQRCGDPGAALGTCS